MIQLIILTFSVSRYTVSFSWENEATMVPGDRLIYCFEVLCIDVSY